MKLDISKAQYVDLAQILGTRVEKIPYTLRLLSENHLRHGGNAAELTHALDAWMSGRNTDFEFRFMPNRLLMHDTTCTPALADIAALRDVLAEHGGDPSALTPELPIEVSVDHSIAVDVYGQRGAALQNAKTEIARNKERYAFMKWASANLQGVHVNPPGTGIMHTINLEQLASVLQRGPDGLFHPDMMLGTDSHTPMINGIGVLAWGVGGLEAESVMFGQPVSIAMPSVVGVELTGALPDKVFATDLALVVTHRLRELGVTGNFVEFFGHGVSTLSADERAVIANMAPEYGASTGYFPADDQTINFLKRTGRPTEEIERIEPIFKQMKLWFDPDARPIFNKQIQIDLAQIGPTLAGPRRPQDSCHPSEVQARVEEAIQRPLSDKAYGDLPDGAIAIAAITSCTNTSDPALLVAAGLVAKKAYELGLSVPSWVKTSLAPGSPSAKKLLERAELLGPLSRMGYDIVGFGCTTCIGNSGPLTGNVEDALGQGGAVCAIVSGNRNFPGRIHPKLDLGFLASPPLVVAYALVGKIDGDIWSDPIGQNDMGDPVYLRDIWPSKSEIASVLKKGMRSDEVRDEFARALNSADWEEISCAQSAQFPWDPSSRSLRRPKFAKVSPSKLGTYSAAPLMVLGDDMTTDHISPAGLIAPKSAAGQWLIERGADPNNLNVFASYRGNWEVMLRGLFTNCLATNYLCEKASPSITVVEDIGEMPIFSAAEALDDLGISKIILAGERYGMGSSRDWAAKGVALLGCRAIIARSFERIHRTNLIGMGILPITITDTFIPQTAGITPADRFEISVNAEQIDIQLDTVLAWKRKGERTRKIQCRIAVETHAEVDLLRQGGILSAILQRKMQARL